MILQDEVMRRYKLVSIDAWREDGGWHWNNQCEVEDGIYLADSTTPRELFGFMRRNDWLSDYSKGRVRLDDAWPYLTIEKRSTGEPVLCFICEEDS